MATITPTRSTIQTGIESATWALLSTVDTATAVTFSGAGPIIGAMQVSGTFGGATIALQGSNDGTNFYSVTDAAGNVITFTAAGIKDFSSACAYLRPYSSGGTADDVNVVIVVRN